jgi:hypothetical protein
MLGGRNPWWETKVEIYVHQESLEKGKRMRMEALTKESLDASFHGRLLKA